jgi:hypothetical protein
MTHRGRRLLVIAALLAIVACVGSWHGYAEYRKAQFLRDLHLVSFSTSMIGSPHTEQELAAHQQAEELGIDLFAAYENNIESGARFHLSWMLITNESPEYYEFAKQEIVSVPWPEVRIWAIRRKQESLSPEYREKLLDLVLTSPTSEAKLAAARWYRKQGKVTEFEDSYHAAMVNGLFWDALDAADQLLESKRYHNDAVDHLLAVVRDSEHFTGRAAFSLLTEYDIREELEPLVDSCRKEPKNGPNRQSLVDKLTKLVEKDVGHSRPNTHAP